MVASVKRGDRQAVRHLYDRYAPAVRAYVASVLRDADAVDDVVQTTFLKLLTGLNRYQPGAVPFEAWLLRVARNTAFDELRRRRVRDAVPMAADVAAPDGAPTRDELPEALDRLPTALREVLVLRHVVGLSVEETADRLGATARDVRTLQERASAGLKVELGARTPVRRGRPVVERLA